MKTPLPLIPPMALLSFLYAFVMRLRAWFYQVGVFPSDTCGAFVVSIGNLQAGGTGKTPIADFFARRWGPRVRLGIVSRGYGRKTSGSLRVVPSADHAARDFGDEPTWLARDLVPVQVGEKRVQAAQDLVASEGLKLILLDDGLQHMALRRTFDIVLMDLTAPRWHWHVLPWGRMRESFAALDRAEVVIFTKTETVKPEILADFERLVRRRAGDVPILRFVQQLTWPESRSGEKLFLAAGLANASAFFNMVRLSGSNVQVTGEMPFADHHAYSESDADRIEAAALSSGADRVLITEKDAVKLTRLWVGRRLPLAVSQLEVRPARESDEKQLEQIDEIILDQVRGMAGNRGQLPVRVPSA